MDAAAYLESRAELTDTALEEIIDAYDGVPRGFKAAVRYSLFPGGKRFRPVLAIGAAEALNADAERVMPAACAIEIIHTYSLVHDDLPCMDDDDIRRGLPTVHRKFDEPTAVLVGDGLQALAFELLARAGNAQVAREIAHAVGIAGMVGGQYLDLESEGEKRALDDVRELHRLKTGALIRASLRAGAILSGASSGRLEGLTRYGEEIGLAFQIVDDILDVVGDDDVMGKRSGTDRARKKTTYPGVVGLDEARQLADDARDRAVAALDGFDDRAEPLRALAAYVVDRKR